MNRAADNKFCQVCGIVDEVFDEHSQLHHEETPKHICNQILREYKHKKKQFSRNGDGMFVFGSAEIIPLNGAAVTKVPQTGHHKVRVYVKPDQQVNFGFTMHNERKDEVLIVGVQLAHPQPQFLVTNNPYTFGSNPYLLETDSKVSIKFLGADVGQYEMPIMFTFFRTTDSKNFIYVREMVVMVHTDNDKPETTYTKSPYSNDDWTHADRFVSATDNVPLRQEYKVPKMLKKLLPHGLEEDALEKIKDLSVEEKQKLRSILIRTRAIFDEGLTRTNYMMYFHHLLWWEEIIARINLRKYNMFGVTLEHKDDVYLLNVPGLAENRPSLLRGDKVFLKPHKSNEVLFESIVKEIEDSVIQIGNIDQSFQSYYTPEALFDVRFMMLRVPMERMHSAVARVFACQQECRLFPEPAKKEVKLKPIYTWYNPLIQANAEQRSAVERILAGTSRRAPYMVFGPPGTGKTMTIVEAIIQIVTYSSKHRVLLCTDSNMAADHIALMLLKYNKKLNINNFILRANSKSRVWSVMPAELRPVSNGSNYTNAYSVSNYAMSSYRVVVTTLLHAAKYGSERSQQQHKLQMTHLFIDEAAQASEPAALVPLCGLLAPRGQLVLAGDPMQLGPVCISRDAKDRGLGKSLMERLKNDYSNLYESDPNYITMLVKNFRSDPEILRLPNELFYENNLKAFAALDVLSGRSVLGLHGGDKAVCFHAVNSKEQRMGKAPSYYNEKELNLLQVYIKALIEKHGVQPADIGVIAPYIRQVYKMKGWLLQNNYEKIDVGTVEAFQGKEKRVILVSTVRANCRLLDYDAKYGLGFLVDDKRFNVTLTRAKAKLIIIGNPTCLKRDAKWRKYMDYCKSLNCYYGQEFEQMDRTAALLTDVALTRFERCRLTPFIRPKNNEQEKKNKRK